MPVLDFILMLADAKEPSAIENCFQQVCFTWMNTDARNMEIPERSDDLEELRETFLVFLHEQLVDFANMDKNVTS